MTFLKKCLWNFDPSINMVLVNASYFHWSHFEIISQKCSLGVRFQNCLQKFDPSKNMAVVNGATFTIQTWRNSSKFFLSATAKKKEIGNGPLKNSDEQSRPYCCYDLLDVTYWSLAFKGGAEIHCYHFPSYWKTFCSSFQSCVWPPLVRWHTPVLEQKFWTDRPHWVKCKW